MLADVMPYLRCPLCGQALAELDATLRCPRGHSFDQARQGYVQLTAGPVAHTGDTGEMVAARAAFLAAGHYDFISRALIEALPAAPDPAAAPPGGSGLVERQPGRPGLVVDVGAGTGHHLAAVLAAWPGAVGLAVDVSKPALRRAARAHPRAGAVLADAWRGLPVADGAAAVLLNVFAPRNGPEFARMLAPGGVLLVVTPTRAHLGALVDALGLLAVDPLKEERVAASLQPAFVEKSSHICSRALSLTRAEVATLVGMGPSAWHTDPTALARGVAALAEPVRVTAEVRVSAYSQVALKS